MQEQIEIFRSLPPAQQQAMIRELQRNLPPAQRQAIVEMLMSQGGVPGAAQQQLGAEGIEGLPEDQQQLFDFLGGVDLERLRPPKFAAGDWLVIELTPREETRSLIGEERARVADFQRRVENGNPYQLDSSGRLLLPGVPAIALQGLEVEEATIRIRTESAIRPFDIVVTRLPLEPVGTAALQPFGYDLFERQRARSFLPNDNLPVPADYVIGPGDTVNIQLFGNENAEFFLPVTRDGVINFPDIGPINVGGLSFDAMRDTINQRVSEQMIGVRASITLGELRSIRVFVLGDVERPGSYMVSGFSTITHALYASGGVKTIGSLRNIALMRDGETVTTLDLYDLLLRGDTSNDVRLQPGDAIFVPPIGSTVAIDGEVRRPAIYEIKNERTVAELVRVAGGFNPNANRTTVKLERVVPNRGMTVQDLDMTGAGANEPDLDGDTIRVLANLEQLENAVRLTGNVQNEGIYQWFPGMRLSDLLPSPELVLPKTDVAYVLIRREVAPNVRAQVISADLGAIWANEEGARNVPLEPRDTVYVFNLDTGRQQLIGPLLEELRAQAPSNQPLPIVRVQGQVRSPGEYPLEPGMRVSDLVRAGGGLSPAAYPLDAELARYEVVNGEYREAELITVNLAAALRGDRAADLLVAPYDLLTVKEVPRWRDEASITLRGEFVFPGTYPIRRGETLAAVIERAGGLTDRAFVEGSVFTRIELQDRERQQIESLARRMEADLAALSLSEAAAGDVLSTGQSLLAQLRSAVPTGRLVIRLDAILAGDRDSDIVLRDGDVLFVPPTTQEVTVLGEVQYPTSHVFERGLGRDDYIARSGGLTRRADQKLIYVVRANGEVIAETGRRWFGRQANTEIRPGDTVVVPLDVDRTRPLARWSAVTQVVYNLAIAAAAVNSF